MALGDKAKDTVQQAAGKAEEFVGDKTNDDELHGQGLKDQAMGQDRMETEKAKDDA